jgi:SAM-dependent methyltransferase
MASELDRINKDVWGSDRVRDIFARREGWTDPGEALVMARLADEVRGGAILDIGVGAGRTLPYLRSISEDYVAIDYVEEQVELARSRYPEARVEHGDARDLEAFADESLDLVVFSFNGIDGVDHDDRRRVFAAVERVLRPRGLFAYSTHNLDYRNAGRAPWHIGWFDPRRGPRAVVSSLRHLPRSTRNYLRLRGRAVRGDGWASLVDMAYDFSCVWHYVTPEEAVRELREARLAGSVEVYDVFGERVEPGGDTRDSPWLQYLVRKPG